MLRISDILTPERTLYSVNLMSKKKAFEMIAEIFASSLPICRPHHIFDALIARERLGSTAIGHGVAMPHAILGETDQVLGCFLLLKESIDFEVQDHMFIDMIFSLIAPSNAREECIQLLNDLGQIFENDTIRKDLRQASSPLDLYEKLIRASSTGAS